MSATRSNDEACSQSAAAANTYRRCNESNLGMRGRSCLAFSLGRPCRWLRSSTAIERSPDAPSAPHVCAEANRPIGHLRDGEVVTSGGLCAVCSA